MTRNPLPAFLFLLLALMGGAHAQVQVPDRTPDSDFPETDPPDRAARLAYLSGEVSLQPAGEEDWAPALLNRPLTTGDKLWTERGARVEIQVGRSVVRLSGETGFSFLDLGDDSLQMRLTAGTLILDVPELAGREQIEIGTPNLALSILRAGSYRVEVNDAGDVTTVRIGGQGEAEANGPGQNVLVRAEQVVTFRGVDDLTASWSSLGPADEFDRWSMDRARRGDRRVASRSAEYVSPEVTGYEDLDEYGSWSSEPEYGYVWTPSRVVLGWSPYRFGRWVWVSPWGWTWIDDAPWGYAPFHYGRWAHVRNRWCWVPGPRHIRPVYAPALVGWVGSRGNYVSWVPLGPRDVYVPWRRFSRHYVERVNFANAHVVDRERVRQALEDRGLPRNYGNRAVPDAITAVARDSFTRGQRVNDRRVNFNEREMVDHDGNDPRPRIAPVRESRLGGATRSNPRFPIGLAARQVIVKRDAPAATARFTRPVDRVREERGASRSTPVAASPAVSSDRDRDRVVRGEREDRNGRDGRDGRDRRDDRPPRGVQPAGDSLPNADSPARENRSEERPAEQYPQYSQRPQRTQDAVRAAVARQLEQREQREREERAEREAPPPSRINPRRESPPESTRESSRETTREVPREMPRERPASRPEPRSEPQPRPEPAPRAAPRDSGSDPPRGPPRSREKDK